MLKDGDAAMRLVSVFALEVALTSLTVEQSQNVPQLKQLVFLVCHTLPSRRRQ